MYVTTVKGMTLRIVQNIHVEAIFHLVVAHEAKYIVVNVATKMDLETDQ